MLKYYVPFEYELPLLDKDTKVCGRFITETKLSPVHTYKIESSGKRELIREEFRVLKLEYAELGSLKIPLVMLRELSFSVKEETLFEDQFISCNFIMDSQDYEIATKALGILVECRDTPKY